MANHGFAGFDPEQTQAVITATNSLAANIRQAIEEAAGVFKTKLVDSDVILGECQYKEDVAPMVTSSLTDLMDNMGLQPAIDAFNKKVTEAEAVINVAFSRNVTNTEQAQQQLASAAKKAAGELGQ